MFSLNSSKRHNSKNVIHIIRWIGVTNAIINVSVWIYLPVVWLDFARPDFVWLLVPRIHVFISLFFSLLHLRLPGDARLLAPAIIVGRQGSPVSVRLLCVRVIRVTLGKEECTLLRSFCLYLSTSALEVT